MEIASPHPWKSALPLFRGAHLSAEHRKEERGPPLGEPRSGPSRGGLAAVGLRHVLGGGTLLALHDVELHRLTLGEGLEARALDGRVVNEAVLLTVVGRDETKALRVVEPLHFAGRTHCRAPDLMWSEYGASARPDYLLTRGRLSPAGFRR